MCSSASNASAYIARLPSSGRGIANSTASRRTGIRSPDLASLSKSSTNWGRPEEFSKAVAPQVSRRRTYLESRGWISSSRGGPLGWWARRTPPTRPMIVRENVEAAAKVRADTSSAPGMKSLRHVRPPSVSQSRISYPSVTRRPDDSLTINGL